jgi:purine-binding chemotaxis protein CheW
MTLQTGAELISVRLAGNLFALDIMSVREIRGWSASTPLPHAPPHVLGMINLRGQVLPVIDLSTLLGLGPSTPGPSSVVVVTQMEGVQAGLLVDAVCDIITIAPGELQDVPEVGAVTEFVDGILATPEGIVSVLALRNALPEVTADFATAA